MNMEHVHVQERTCKKSSLLYRLLTPARRSAAAASSQSAKPGFSCQQRAAESPKKKDRHTRFANMAFDAKSRALTDFLQKQADAAPDLAGEYSQMSDLFTRKLWHQLTLLLEAFVKLPAAAPHLQVSYETCS